MVARAPTCIVKAWKEAFSGPVLEPFFQGALGLVGGFGSSIWVRGLGPGAARSKAETSLNSCPSLEQCIVKPGKPNQSIGSAIFIGFRHVIVPHLLIAGLGNCIWAGSSFGICGR